MLARSLISDSIPPLRTSDTGDTALQLMADYQVKHLPIVNNQQFLGLISEDDILEKATMDNPVGNVQLTYYKPYVLEGSHFYQAIKCCVQLRLSLVPVVVTEMNYVVVITLRRLVHEFASYSSILDPGGIITLTVNVRDFAVSEIARIVESNSATILSLYTNNDPNSTKMEVVLKINREDLKDIISSFERYDYEVIDVFQKSEMEEDLMDRYESFIKYMNI
jgi:CBS domain-containing protein